MTERCTALFIQPRTMARGLAALPLAHSRFSPRPQALAPAAKPASLAREVGVPSPSWEKKFWLAIASLCPWAAVASGALTRSRRSPFL
jgi:hypothetical protein